MSDASVQLKFEPDHFAERLRVRKGQTVRYTRADETRDYRVTRVSMPDEFGRVDVSLEAAQG